MKDLFKRVSDFASEIKTECEGNDTNKGVAVIIAALDTTVEPEGGEGNCSSLIMGTGIDLIPLLGELLNNDTLKPLIAHAMLANILMRKDVPSEHSESKKED